MTQRAFKDGRQTVLDRVLLLLVGRTRLTVAEMGDEMSDNPDSIRSAILRGHKMGLVRIADWQSVKPNRYAAVWGRANRQPDAQKPEAAPPEAAKKMRNAEYRKRNRMLIAMRNYPKRGKPVPIGFQLTYQPREKKC